MSEHNARLTFKSSEAFCECFVADCGWTFSLPGPRSKSRDKGARARLHDHMFLTHNIRVASQHVEEINDDTRKHRASKKRAKVTPMRKTASNGRVFRGTARTDTRSGDDRTLFDGPESDL